MESLSGAASITAIIQTTEAITQIFRTYLIIGRIKEGRWDIECLQEELAALSQTLEPLQRLLHNQSPKKTGTSQGLLDDITKCSATLSRLRDKLDPKTSQTLLSKWGFQEFKWPIKHEEATNVVREIRRCKCLFWLSLKLNQTQSINHLINQKIDLGRLQIAKGAAFNDYGNQHTKCLPGTQVELLREIDHWVKSPDGKSLFWLNGTAGTGKSTIARTVSSCLNRRGLLGASFFFKRGEQDRGIAKLLFSTLAKQLGDTIPQLVPSIQHAIKDDPDISERALDEQFQKLILQPLMARNPGRPTSTILIVIDALDECDQDDDVRGILELLPRVWESRFLQVRFLLTSRPDLPIKLGFQGAIDDHQHMIIHKIPSSVIEHDIRLYLKHEFSRLQQERNLPTDWPEDQTINTLVERATPSFIYATTLLRFVGDDPTEHLKVIQSDQNKYTTEMEGTYIPILNRLLTNEDEEKYRQLIHEFKDTIGILILLATPLSISSFAKLLQMETDKAQKQFKLFHSVLDNPVTPDGPVRILHSSFRDFLLDNKQEESSFRIDEGLVHKKLTVQCLKVMQDSQYGLRKNICNLRDDRTPRHDIDKDTISHCLPSELQYACQYWVYHLVQSHDSMNELAQVFSFLQSHFLYWVEAMSLLGIILEAVEMIQRLRLAIKAYEDYELSDFVLEACGFIFQNRQIADTAPLQLYSIGLVFAPEDSRIRRAFKSELSTWSLVPRVKERWNGHTSWFELVAFSPDGQLLASITDDHTVKLWDPRTGELSRTLKGHSGWVSSVSFSLDSRMLASASIDGTVRLWDSRTGDLSHTLGGLLGRTHSVCFLSNDELMGSGFDNNIVKIWDARTGELRAEYQ